MKDHQASAHLDQYRKESEVLVQSHDVKTVSLASVGSVNCNYAGECEAEMEGGFPGGYPNRKAVFVTIDVEDKSKEEYVKLISEHIQNCFLLDRCMYYDFGFDMADTSKVHLYEVYENMVRLNHPPLSPSAHIPKPPSPLPPPKLKPSRPSLSLTLIPSSRPTSLTFLGEWAGSQPLKANARVEKFSFLFMV